jgi:predicted transcriptional regulator
MTKLLSEVMRQITELPEQRQDDAARVLLMMLEQDPEQYRLTDAQLREVDAAIADTDAGNFAPEKEIDAILSRSWA